ncbi:hypothetical protein GCM10027176_41620 [Actinoallomurus bryophytorum]
MCWRSLPDVIAVSPDYDRHPQLRPRFDMVRANLADTGPGAGVTRPALLDLALTQYLTEWRLSFAARLLRETDARWR